MNRREFIGWVGVGSLASSLPLAIAACSPQTTEIPTPESRKPIAAPRPDGFQPIIQLADLEKMGQVLVEDFAGGQLLVISAAAPNPVQAINPICTHAGCTVAWQKEPGILACPCHGAKFSLQGAVEAGPADRPLPTYPVKIEAGIVLIKA